MKQYEYIMINRLCLKIIGDKQVKENVAHDEKKTGLYTRTSF